MIINNVIKNKKIPIYGDGKNIRDWIYVDDNCRAIELVARKGKVGNTYNIGGNNEISNLNLAIKICDILDNLLNKKIKSRQLIKFVEDRKGHDFRYSLDIGKIKKELKWTPRYNLDHGLKKACDWYLRKNNVY